MLSKKLAGSALVFAVLISCYVGIVEIVNVFACPEVLREFSVKSLRNHGSACQFVMGDSLVVEAFSDLADAYALEIYHSSVLIFEKEGGFDGSKAEIHVPIVAPVFSAGNAYPLVLHAYVYNKPILGVHFSDYETYVFETVSIEAKLGLNVEYNESWRSLSLCANLTDVAGYPIVNEAVDFSVQYCGRQRATNGWVPIGSAMSNANGLASLNVVFNMRSGSYLVKAFHAEKLDFGKAECTTTVNVSSRKSFQGFASNIDGSICFGSGILSGNGSVIIDVSSNSPYACLPMNANATYTTDILLGGPYRMMLFYLDYVNSTGCFGSADLTLVNASSPYVYEVSFAWEPDVIGSHVLIGGVVVGDGKDVARAMENGTGIIASTSVELDIQRCPLNAVVGYPQGTYGLKLPLTVSLAGPRSYDPESSDSVVHILAPMINYSEVEYVSDEPVNASLVKLYINSTFVSSNITDQSGLALFVFNLSAAYDCFKLNVTITVDDCLHVNKVVERFITFSRVSICDTPNSVSDDFKLNCTFTVHSENGDVYVGVNTTLKVETSVFDMPIWSAPVSAVIAKSELVRNTSTTIVPVPTGCNYLRVVRLLESFDNSSQRIKIRFANDEWVYVDSQWCAWIPHGVMWLSVHEDPLLGDADGDGKVDGKDVAIVSAAFGTIPGDPKWDPRADLNKDLKVDGKDTGIVSKYYGDTEYLGADIEFLETVFVKEIPTDNLGSVAEAWKPNEIGEYLVQIKLSSVFDSTLVDRCNATVIKASTNIVKYFNVVGRPIDLSISYLPSEPTLDDEVTMYASCFDKVLGEYVENLHTSFYVFNYTTCDFVFLASAYTNSSGIATISWHPRDYLSTCPIDRKGYFVLLANVTETAQTAAAEKVPIPVDTRYPTKLEFVDEVLKVPAGQPCSLTAKFFRADNGSSVGEKLVYLYFNTTEPSGFGYTDVNGTITWYPNVSKVGVYWVKAKWQDEDGDSYYKPANMTECIVIAEVVPVSVLFDVQPREFTHETDLTLTATVYNATSNDTLTEFVVRFYEVYADGSRSLVGTATTNDSGVATVKYLYVAGPCTFVADVATGQNFITSPILLTIGNETSLYLNVTRCYSENASHWHAYRHTISGELFCGSTPLVCKKITINVNGTRHNAFTDSTGQFDIDWYLIPKDNKPTTYNVTAIFEDEDAANVTVYGYTPNGTRYPVSTTIYYGLKPSVNSLSLTVEPPKTEVKTAPKDMLQGNVTATQASVIVPPQKTPEQIEREAQQKGWMRVEPEFSWWYPWFRLHLKLDAYTPHGNPNVDYGWSCLPWGESYKANDKTIAEMFNDIADELERDMLIDCMVGVFIQFGVAIVLGRTLIGTAVAIGTYLAYSSLRTIQLFLTSGGKPEAWLGAFITSAISGTGGLVLSGIRSVSGFLTSVGRCLLGKISSISHSLWPKGINLFDITGLAFAFIDFAFMAFYLSMFLSTI
jgi:hypothetical protein